MGEEDANEKSQINGLEIDRKPEKPRHTPGLLW
jgi:hypothetical protein